MWVRTFAHVNTRLMRPEAPRQEVNVERYEVKLTDVEHSRVCYDRGRYCGHPRQSGIFLFEHGELVALHSHAPSGYAAPEDVSHSFTTGYAGRARILLQRSLDAGWTWPREHDVMVWEEPLSLEEKRARLYQGEEPGAGRAHIDLSASDTAAYFARPATGPDGPDGKPTLECSVFRSADRGRIWEGCLRGCLRRPASTPCTATPIP